MASNKRSKEAKLIQTLRMKPLTEETLHHFSSGAIRSDDAKGLAFSQICPSGLREVARRYGIGEVKYFPYNWAKGMTYDQTLRHLQLHLNDLTAGAGKILPDETAITDLAAIAWNAITLIHFLSKCQCHKQHALLEKEVKAGWSPQS